MKRVLIAIVAALAVFDASAGTYLWWTIDHKELHHHVATPETRGSTAHWLQLP